MKLNKQVKIGFKIFNFVLLRITISFLMGCSSLGVLQVLSLLTTKSSNFTGNVQITENDVETIKFFMLLMVSAFSAAMFMALEVCRQSTYSYVKSLFLNNK